MVGRWTRALLDRGIPPSITDPSLRVRARFVLSFFALGALGFAVSTGLDLALDASVPRTNFLALPAFLAGLFLLRVTGRLRASGAVAIGLACLTIISQAIEHGGFVPILSWAAVCVMGAGFVLGIRAGAMVIGAFVLGGAGIATGQSLGLFHGFSPSLLDPVRGSIGWTVILALQSAMALIFMRFYAEEHGALARQLELARAEADQSSRAKSVFLATMSHEIRTPMNGVLASADLLRRGELSPAERELAEVIFGSGEALLSILNDVLDFSKIEAGKVALASVAFDPRELAGGVVALLRPRAKERGLRLELEVDPAVPRGLTGDPGRLRQVLLNLVSNALKFTEVGVVALRVLSPRPGVLRISVEDTGPGLTPAQQARLFKPFSQADASIEYTHGGTGLGLAISERLVEAMGGQIAIESILGRGSAFYFELELPAAEPPEPRDVARVSQSPIKAPVLVVDDNDVNRLVAERMLKRLGLEPRVARTGEEALELIGRERFSLVLMDRRLPGIDGLEVTRRVRRSAGPERGTPIVALTASAMKEDVEACEAAGMNDVLTKPVTIDMLHTCVSRCASRL